MKNNKNKSFKDLVREDMESKGWLITKFNNNLNIIRKKNKPLLVVNKMIPKTNSGFPTFMCWIIDKIVQDEEIISDKITYMIGIEVKVNGLLNEEEIEKCKFLIDNKIFHKILITKKNKFKNKTIIEYIDFIDYIK